jgi:hypothetical protein
LLIKNALKGTGAAPAAPEAPMAPEEPKV